MSNIKSVVKTKPEVEEETEESLPLFRCVNAWYTLAESSADIPGTGVMPFLADVIEIARGVETLLEMRAFDDLQDPSEGEQRLLSNGAHMDLSRFCIASMRNLNNSATGLIDWTHKYHTPEGRAEREGGNHA